MIPTRIAGTGLSVILSIMMIGAGSIPAAGQISGSTILGAYRNSIPTAVPFLLIAPDARSSALGDGGVASSPDVHSQHWNVARYSLTDDRAGFAFTYAPWLTNLLPDISHFYTSGFYRLGELQALSGSVRYFTTGTILFAGLAAGLNTLFQPREYAFDAGYSRRFSDHLSGGIALRYIYSRLSPPVASSTGDFSQPGTTIAGDLGLYYRKELSLVGKTGEWALGMLISNMGPTVQYAQGIDSHPLPTNLRLGGRMTLNLGENSRLSFLTDLNKLMAPTPPVVKADSASGELIIVRGKPAPESWIGGTVRSFWDAPGIQQNDGSYSVSGEELREISWSFGAELMYREWLVIRAGHFREHASKGNRKLFSFGLGTRLGILAIDVSYLLPTNGQNSPLSNTFRFTLGMEMGDLRDTGQRLL